MYGLPDTHVAYFIFIYNILIKIWNYKVGNSLWNILYHISHGITALIETCCKTVEPSLFLTSHINTNGKVWRCPEFCKFGTHVICPVVNSEDSSRLTFSRSIKMLLAKRFGICCILMLQNASPPTELHIASPSGASEITPGGECLNSTLDLPLQSTYTYTIDSLSNMNSVSLQFWGILAYSALL